MREERGCQSRLADQRRTGRADRRLTPEGYEYIVLAGPFGLKNLPGRGHGEGGGWSAPAVHSVLMCVCVLGGLAPDDDYARSVARGPLITPSALTPSLCE